VQRRVSKLSPELEQSLECILKLSPVLGGKFETLLWLRALLAL